MKTENTSPGIGLDDATRAELERAGIIVSQVDFLYNWARGGSVWPLTFGLACCAIEMIASATSRFDIARFGSEVFRPSPRQADLMIVSGTVTKKMAPQVVRIYNQMPEPKWCIAMGSCAISGDFYRDIYSVVPGIDTVVPVDVYIPGCPPNSDQVMVGLERLQERIRSQRAGKQVPQEQRPVEPAMIKPSIPRFDNPDRDPTLNQQQHDASRNIGLGGNESRENDRES